MTLESLESYIAEKNRSKDALLLGIFDKVSSIHVGNVKLEPILPGQDACLGIFIGSNEMRGKTFGFDTIQLLSNFAKTEYSLKSIYLGVNVNNHAAMKLYQKLGFSPDIIYGNSFDDIRMRILL